MSEITEKMYMAWHCGEEMLNPEIYGNTKKEYKENLIRVTAGITKNNYLMVRVEIVIKDKPK